MSKKHRKAKEQIKALTTEIETMKAIKADSTQDGYVEPPMYWGLPPSIMGGGSTFAGIVVTPYTALNSPSVYSIFTGTSSSIAHLPIYV